MSVNKKLVAEEEADIKFNDDLETLEDKSSKMLQQEILALSVLEQLPPNEEVAFAELEVIWREGDPFDFPVDQSAMMNFVDNGNS